MYYMDTLTQLTVTDSLIPFVRTISNVARDIDLNYHEINAGIKMPTEINKFIDDLFFKNAYRILENHLKKIQV